MPAGTTPAAPKTSNALVVGGGEEPDFGEYAKTGGAGGIGSLVGGRELRVLFILDGTGSMGKLLAQAKDTVVQMAKDIQAEVGVPVLIEVWIVRDYCDDISLILQKSPRTQDTDVTAKWLATIEVAGGGGNGGEGYDYGLKKVEELPAGDTPDIIFLCGDELAFPTREKLQEVIDEGCGYGTSVETDDYRTAMEVAAVLKNMGIPIHCFSIGSFNHANFQSIATAGGGLWGDLDEYEQLLNMAVMAALQRVGGAAAVSKFAAGKTLSAGAAAYSEALMKYQGPKKS